MKELDYIKKLEKRIEQLESAMLGVNPINPVKPLWEIVLGHPDLYNGNSQMVIGTMKFSEIEKLLIDLSDNYDGIRNIFKLSLYVEFAGTYSGSIHNDDLDDNGAEKLWLSINNIIMGE